MTRLTLLRLLGVEDLCQQHERRCRVWHNNILILPGTLTPLSLTDRDYVHVFIRDDDQMQCQILGTDDSAFLQTLPVTKHRIASTHRSTPTIQTCNSRQRPLHRRQVHQDENQFEDEQLHQLRALWNQPHRRHRGLQNEEVMMFDTWYLCSQNHPRCSNPRAIALPNNPNLWSLRIAQVWRDRLRPHWAFRIVPFQPDPAQERHGGHLLIIQLEHPDEAGVKKH